METEFVHLHASANNIKILNSSKKLVLDPYNHKYLIPFWWINFKDNI